MPERRTIRTDYLARVEGEGAMSVRLATARSSDVELRIFEPPRFFEALLRGRSFLEAPDITARICGICPVAYQMSAVQAMEDVCGVEVPEPIRALRRLLYCGEWIESHALHVYMLHAPDFLGYEGAVELARDAPAAVERGLALKKTGNEVMALIGGREIHPINVRVGGFYRAPTRRELRHARRAARAGARGGARDRALDRRLRLPRARASTASSSRSSEPDSYAIEQRPDRLRPRASTSSPAEYDEHFVEEHVERSNALHSRLRDGATYLCGPLARFALNGDALSPLALEAAREAGLELPVPRRVPQHRRPQRRARLRVRRGAAPDRRVRGAGRALRAGRAGRPASATARPRRRAACSTTATELDADGTILDAKIVPPTSQNQLAIEDDLRAVVGRYARPPGRASCARSASRRSATTTPASRARRTSCSSRSERL